MEFTRRAGLYVEGVAKLARLLDLNALIHVGADSLLLQLSGSG